LIFVQELGRGVRDREVSMRGDQPTLTGPSVELRPFTLDDVEVVAKLAGAREVADTTLSIPYPYPREAASGWIQTHRTMWESGGGVHFAITVPSEGVVGAMSLVINQAQDWAELGYWVGVPYWGRGYCTDAAWLAVDFAFRELGLHRVQAHHLIRNPASGRVMQKIGMQREGVHREAVKKWDVYEDIASYAVLASQWG
jgi:RimJ/RimL family protein N-acetyltransferase